MFHWSIYLFIFDIIVVWLYVSSKKYKPNFPHCSFLSFFEYFELAEMAYTASSNLISIFPFSFNRNSCFLAQHMAI